MTKAKLDFNPDNHSQELIPLLRNLDKLGTISNRCLFKLLKTHPKSGQGFFSKTELITSFNHFAPQENYASTLSQFAQKLQKKPTRSISGIIPVTVLTKPFPCPGKCIFCPSDIRMPKSYVSSEPGAQRAAHNAFDPYLQTYNRLRAFAGNGHRTDKVELIILGGTWSFYPEQYQIWFIKRCFDALNDFGAGHDHTASVIKFYNFDRLQHNVTPEKNHTTYNQLVSRHLTSLLDGRLHASWENATWTALEQAQQLNSQGTCRNVGLVIETRPDHIDREEIQRIRRLGCTKTQIGLQSLSDRILRLNHRGHTVAATRKAMRLLRAAGFKIHAHWMANLYGSTPAKDVADYKKIFSDPDFRPDELKIYPTALLDTAQLINYYLDGRWQPYTREELLKVVSSAIAATPPYCRLTRVIRDFPSPDIVTGNKTTNFRQVAEASLAKKNLYSQDIRAREIKSEPFDATSLTFTPITYQTSTSTEHFLQYVTPGDRLVAFLRLSLPNQPPQPSHSQLAGAEQSRSVSESKPKHFIAELDGSALIREVHVYGPAAGLSERHPAKAQHLGLGTKLVGHAKKIAMKADYSNLAVISAVGTRGYYAKLGFKQGSLYQHLRLS